MAGKGGFGTKKYPILPKKCGFCKEKFKSQDPTQRFCSDKCRHKNWVKFNRDKVALNQKRWRIRNRTIEE